MRPTIPVSADKRVSFTHSTYVAGVDLTSAAFFCQIRHKFGDVGVPIISLSNAASGVQGVSAVFIPEITFYDSDSCSEVTTSATQITMRVDEVTLEALPLATPTNLQLVMVYDLHVTPPGADKYVAYGGEFFVFPGSTI